MNFQKRELFSGSSGIVALPTKVATQNLCYSVGSYIILCSIRFYDLSVLCIKQTEELATKRVFGVISCFDNVVSYRIQVYSASMVYLDEPAK